MKTFKQGDLLLQIAMIISFAAASLRLQDQTFIWAYCTVGAWQIVSMIVHQVQQRNTRTGGRRYYYHRVSAFTLVAMASGFIFPPLFFLWFVMLFAAPFMAVYYTAICFKEVYQPAKRPLELI
jgi:hypothetical protein